MGEDQAFAFLKRLQGSVLFNIKDTTSMDPLLTRNEISVEGQRQATDVFGTPARTDIGWVGKNGPIIRNTIAGVQTIPIDDWYEIVDRRPGWIKRWTKEISGPSGKEARYVPPQGE